MDEKRNLELMLLENIEEVLGKKAPSEKPASKNQTNPQTNPQTSPIYNKLLNFKNSKIGKFSVKDLLKW